MKTSALTIMSYETDSSLYTSHQGSHMAIIGGGERILQTQPAVEWAEINRRFVLKYSAFRYS